MVCSVTVGSHCFCNCYVHLQDQYTANTLQHSFYYRRIGKWGHFSVFQQIKDISKSCYAMDKLKGHNQIFLTEVEHQSDGKILCKSEGR